MARISRRTQAIAAFIIVIAAGYAVAKFWEAKSQVPQDFVDARAKGAIIAQTIVSDSNSSTATLEQINELDKQGNYTQALALTKSLVDQSQDLRNEAVDLSAQVGEMTKALSGIKSFDARQAALESISSRLALINQLVNYSGDLAHLLDVLTRRFSGGQQVKGEVQGAVNQINTDINAINNFNTQADQAMNQFDKLVTN